jgi:hypothetical protein
MPRRHPNRARRHSRRAPTVSRHCFVGPRHSSCGQRISIPLSAKLRLIPHVRWRCGIRCDRCRISGRALAPCGHMEQRRRVPRSACPCRCRSLSESAGPRARPFDRACRSLSMSQTDHSRARTVYRGYREQMPTLKKYCRPSPDIAAARDGRIRNFVVAQLAYVAASEGSDREAAASRHCDPSFADFATAARRMRASRSKRLESLSPVRPWCGWPKTLLRAIGGGETSIVAGRLALRASHGLEPQTPEQPPELSTAHK